MPDVCEEVDADDAAGEEEETAEDDEESEEEEKGEKDEEDLGAEEGDAAGAGEASPPAKRAKLEPSAEEELAPKPKKTLAPAVVGKINKAMGMAKSKYASDAWPDSSIRWLLPYRWPCGKAWAQIRENGVPARAPWPFGAFVCVREWAVCWRGASLCW